MVTIGLARCIFLGRWLRCQRLPMTKGIWLFGSRELFITNLCVLLSLMPFNTRPTFMEDWHPIEVKQVKASTLDWFPYASYNHNLRSSDNTDASDGTNVGLDFILAAQQQYSINGCLEPRFWSS